MGMSAVSTITLWREIVRGERPEQELLQRLGAQSCLEIGGWVQRADAAQQVIEAFERAVATQEPLPLNSLKGVTGEMGFWVCELQFKCGDVNVLAQYWARKRRSGWRGAHPFLTRFVIENEEQLELLTAK